MDSLKGLFANRFMLMDYDRVATKRELDCSKALSC